VPEPPFERPFTIETAAEHLGCSARHVRNMCAAGKIRYFRLGQLLRIPAAAMRELEASAQFGAAEGEPPMETDKEANERRWAARLVRIRGAQPEPK
jgi:excisionase family DNA binding protein